MTVPKACPFCGKSDKLQVEEWNDELGLFRVVYCNNHTVSALLEVWESRPIEDALRLRLDKAIKALEILADLETVYPCAGAPMTMAIASRVLKEINTNDRI